MFLKIMCRSILADIRTFSVWRNCQAVRGEISLSTACQLPECHEQSRTSVEVVLSIEDFDRALKSLVYNLLIRTVGGV